MSIRQLEDIIRRGELAGSISKVVCIQHRFKPNDRTALHTFESPEIDPAVGPVFWQIELNCLVAAPDNHTKVSVTQLYQSAHGKP